MENNNVWADKPIEMSYGQYAAANPHLFPDGFSRQDLIDQGLIKDDIESTVNNLEHIFNHLSNNEKKVVEKFIGKLLAIRSDNLRIFILEMSHKAMINDFNERLKQHESSKERLIGQINQLNAVISHPIKS